jgi:aromatic-L-amino-acid decarboxylase
MNNFDEDSQFAHRLDVPLLAWDGEAMRRLGYAAVDWLVEHHSGLRDLPPTRCPEPSALAARLHRPPPNAPQPPEAVWRQLRDDVLAYHGITQHPRFFAFVPSPSNWVGAVGDFLASGFNCFVGNWLEGAGPTQLELVVVDWLRSWCGLPGGTGGVLLSGGTMANLTALAAARQARLGGRPEGVVYASDQTHASIRRALRLLGFADEQYVVLPSDEQFRLRIDLLQQRVAADRAEGRRPFCVVANVGTTNTGTVDPLPELAAAARRLDLWLHADGAYGAAAALAAGGCPQLAGLGEVDSLAIDPHKWLFQPYALGCALVREPRWLHEAFALSAEYLRDAQQRGGELNLYDFSPELTRPFRALKLWLTVQLFGLDALRAAVAKGIALAEEAQRAVERTRHLRVVTPAQLAVLTFRHEVEGDSPPQGDARQQYIVRRMFADGFATVTTTQLRGRTVLRLCTINPRTTRDDIWQTIERLQRFGEEFRGE